MNDRNNFLRLFEVLLNNYYIIIKFSSQPLKQNLFPLKQ